MEQFICDNEQEDLTGFEEVAENLGHVFFPGITRRKISSKYTSHLVNYKHNVLVVPLNLCHLSLKTDDGSAYILQEGTADGLMKLISMKLGSFWFAVRAISQNLAPITVTDIYLKNWNSFGLKMRRQGEFKTPFVIEVRKPEEFRRVSSVMSLCLTYRMPVTEMKETSVFTVQTLHMKPKMLSYLYFDVAIFTSERNAIAFAQGRSYGV